MEKQIEILKKWLVEAEKTHAEKYGEILKNNDKSNAVIYDDAVMIEGKLKMWRKKLKKMLGGKEMPERILKKIDNLPCPQELKINLI